MGAARENARKQDFRVGIVAGESLCRFTGMNHIRFFLRSGWFGAASGAFHRGLKPSARPMNTVTGNVLEYPMPVRKASFPTSGRNALG